MQAPVSQASKKILDLLKNFKPMILASKLYEKHATKVFNPHGWPGEPLRSNAITFGGCNFSNGETLKKQNPYHTSNSREIQVREERRKEEDYF